MIKTIKVKKQFRLDELLKYVWDSKDNGMMCISDKSEKEVTVMQNYIDCNDIKNGIIAREDTFTVEVEEEITEDTVLEHTVIVLSGNEIIVGKHVNTNIKAIRHRYATVEQIHTLVENKLELIWEVLFK